MFVKLRWQNAASPARCATPKRSKADAFGPKRNGPEMTRPAPTRTRLIAFAALALTGLAGCSVQPPPGPVLRVPHGAHAPQWIYQGIPPQNPPCYSRVDRHREIRNVGCPPHQ